MNLVDFNRADLSTPTFPLTGVTCPEPAHSFDAAHILADWSVLWVG